MREACFEVPAIFMRLAQRKGDVHAVHKGKIRTGRLILHRGDFSILKCVGLQVRKCIPGITVVRPCGYCLAIRINRIFLRAGGFQRMPLAG